VNDDRFRGVGYLLALLMYVSVMFVVSYLSVSRALLTSFLPWDKLLHFFQYFPVGFLVAMWRMKRRETGSLAGMRIWVLCCVTMLAVLDEGIQFFVVFRDGSVLDMLADVLGGLAGGEVARYVIRIRNTA
jgi:VanZ family protein